MKYNQNVKGATGKRSAPENILVKNNRAYWGVGGYFFCVFTVAAEHISKTEHSYGKADNRNQTFCRKHTTPPSFFKSRRA